MKNNWTNALLGILFVTVPLNGDAKQWSLKECLDYALQNNITLQKTKLQRLSAKEDIMQSQAMLLPSLSMSTSQNGSFNPWPEKGSFVVAGDKVQTSVDKFYYNGSYNLNANWTVWNGNKNYNQIKINKLAEAQAELDSIISANNIQEQIAQLYVQILYSSEAIKVNQESLNTSRNNEQRGINLLEVGKISKADLAQLTSQRAQDEFNVIQAENNTKNYKRQLKQLLQITNEDVFDVEIPTMTDQLALQEIPKLNSVYTSALNARPEIKNALLNIETSDLNIKMAKAQRLPTIGVNAGLGANTTSMNKNAWGIQLKNNLNLGGGVSVSIPLFDQRQARTALNKAIIQKENYMLDLKDKQTTLFSTIENYWLQAMTNQKQFVAAKASSESAKSSYELLSEQFQLGLKNIIELMNGKVNMLMAQQNELQSKYLTILNIDMLKFYQNGKIE